MQINVGMNIPHYNFSLFDRKFSEEIIVTTVLYYGTGIFYTLQENNAAFA